MSAESPSLKQSLVATANHNLKTFHADAQHLAATDGSVSLLTMLRNIVEAVTDAARQYAADMPELIDAAESAIDDLWLEYVVPVNWPIPDLIEPAVEQSALLMAKRIIRAALAVPAESV